MDVLYKRNPLFLFVLATILTLLISSPFLKAETLELTGITLYDSHILMLDHGNVRDYHRLSVTGAPGEVAPEVEWKSSNPAVADVDDTGLVRAYSEGAAVITATTLDGEHSATSRVTVLPVTKERIRSRWERYKPVFDYDPRRTYTECLKYCFEEPPSLEAPYKAGKLDPVFEQDALNMANYVRFLAGLPDDLVIGRSNAQLEHDRLEVYAQHGAVLLAVSEFSHFPPQPDDMDDEFFWFGRFGTQGGLIASGYSLIGSIRSGWINSVGHRTRMLNTRYQKTGFGYVGGIGRSVMITSGHTREEFVEYDYIAWPNSGWFPTKEFPQTRKWSVTFSSLYWKLEDEEVELVLTRLSDGYSWSFSESAQDGYLSVEGTTGPTIIFRPGPEGREEYQGQYRIEITSGIGAFGIGPTEIEYTVNFFDLDSVSWTPVTSVTLDRNSLELTTGESASLQATVSPSNADDQDVIYSSSNTLVATVNSNGRVTAVGPGEADIKVVTKDGKHTATSRVTVKYVPLESISLSDTDLYLQGVRSKLRMPVQFNPSNASNKQLEWSSDNEEVVTVSPSGVLTAIAPGEAQITARSLHYEGIETSTTVTVADDGVHYGDVNGDGHINVSDAIRVLRHIVGLSEIEQERLTAADVTGDGTIQVADAIRILRYIVGLY